MHAWDEILRSPATTQALREYLLGRRWYRSKALTPLSARVRDAIPLPGGSAAVLLEVRYDEAGPEVYLLALSQSGGGAGEIAGGLRDASGDPWFYRSLLDAVAGNERLPGSSGELAASPTPAFDRVVGPAWRSLPVRVSTAEQTNSAAFFNERLVLKLFRKLEVGVNPDFEIGRFLTERGFTHTPAVAGHIEYRSNDGSRMSLAMLQQFVPNRGDAWDYTLGELDRLLNRVSGPAPELPGEHPLDLAAYDPPVEARRLMAPYLESVRVLGERTAEMHIVLADPDAGPEFAPEPFTEEFRARLHSRLLSQADQAIALVRARLQSLSPPAAADARRLLDRGPRIRERFARIANTPIDAIRIRHHGDFHLGQVLYTGSDFFIIDFEGEPARPLEERRMKDAAMRDAAGMVRSFRYAGHSAAGKRGGALDSWAAFWTACASSAFLDAYFRKAAGRPFLPPEPAQRRLLFDALTLEKALYEISYELNNRPDWVGIPLRGIAGLVG